MSWTPPQPIEHSGQITIFKTFPDHVEPIPATWVKIRFARRGTAYVSYRPRSQLIGDIFRSLVVRRDGDFLLTVEVDGSQVAQRARAR